VLLRGFDQFIGAAQQHRSHLESPSAKTAREPIPFASQACSGCLASSGKPRSASTAARLIVVVVFPLPPFWFMTATVRTFGTPWRGWSKQPILRKDAIHAARHFHATRQTRVLAD
jgi:hypothetical protein